MRTILTMNVAVAVLSGCGGAQAHGLRVVASTNVYGDIARQIGGGDVHVTSILSDPNADPHLFEAGTGNAFAIARANVVIENGAGYDAFMDKLESASPSASRVVVTVADTLAPTKLGSVSNPHVWYAVPALPRIARAIERAFVRADPKHEQAYAKGEARFVASLAPLRRAVASINAAHRGDGVASTEPVPDYLLAAAGLRELAPPSFTRAIEDGSEPTPGALAAMLRLVRDRRVRVLLYNSQAVSPISARVRSAARSAGIPVVAVTETLPPGQTFQSWQLGQVRALAAALAR